MQKGTSGPGFKVMTDTTLGCTRRRAAQGVVGSDNVQLVDAGGRQRTGARDVPSRRRRAARRDAGTPRSPRLGQG